MVVLVLVLVLVLVDGGGPIVFGVVVLVFAVLLVVVSDVCPGIRSRPSLSRKGVA